MIVTRDRVMNIAGKPGNCQPKFVLPKGLNDPGELDRIKAQERHGSGDGVVFDWMLNTRRFFASKAPEDRRTPKPGGPV